MSKTQGQPRPQGEVRQSQIISTYGPGALVDMAEHSVIIGGLQSWRGEGPLVHEDRLLSALRARLELPRLELRSPPQQPDRDAGPPAGLRAFVFPEWFVAQHEEQRWGGVARPLVHARGLDKGSKAIVNKRRVGVVPIRFVQACINGHISDIQWRLFAHDGDSDCSRLLWLVERGTSGDLAAVEVRCECGASRGLNTATLQGAAPLGFCRGRQPWLGGSAYEDCRSENGQPVPSRFLVRHATNAWFGSTASVIHIPDRMGKLKKAVDNAWDSGLRNTKEQSQIAMLRELVPAIKAALEGFDTGEVYVEVLRRNGLESRQTRSVKEVELETFLAQQEEFGEESPGSDFHARRLQLPVSAVGPMALVDRVVLVHRLREVTALLGFTRFEPPATSFNGELDLPVRRAELAREIKWLPAVENRGEGILLVLKKEAVESWLNRPAVRKRHAQLQAGFEVWRSAEPLRKKAEAPGLAYTMLHSLSHLLLTAISLECGYSASAIRERIYASSQLGYAILLYTGTPDAEGTLGGLVQVARRIDQHLKRAIEAGRLCSNDPVCAQHLPDSREEDRPLHGAACHGCLLISETSCEHRNVFLDRALVVPTVDVANAAFFEPGQ